MILRRGEMKKRWFLIGIAAAAGLTALVAFEAASRGPKKEDCFFLKSLHYTTEGMRHWYRSEQGGLELLTGISYDDLGCKGCHVPGCDRCHAVEEEGRFHYSVEAAKEDTLCLECHGRAKGLRAIDRAADQEDVHVAQGMGCMDCHTPQDVHGDGTKRISMKEPGAIGVRCEECHDEISEIESHSVHKRKLACEACHVRHVLTCSNCHFDTLVEKGKKKAIPLSGWTFLMNYEGRVVSANMQNFVANGNNTFMLFAPHTSHSIMKEGRLCGDCHGTETVKKVQNGAVTLTTLKEGKVENLKGIVPVVEGVDYQCVYQHYDDEGDRWIPIPDAPKPLYQYPGFGTPLDEQQLERLATPQNEPR
jgi:hypothetical protein